MRSDATAIVIGGGFYGCAIGLHLQQRLRRVTIIECEPDLLRRASFTNQARVHGGYHYPRSLLTALRSRVNLPRFVQQYEACIDRGFDAYYAISSLGSNVTANQFRQFCQRIKAPLLPVGADVRRLLHPDLIEEVFRVEEFAFNADRLREQLAEQIAATDISVLTNCDAMSVEARSDGLLRVAYRGPQGEATAEADLVFNGCYSQINRLRLASGLPAIPLKHEWVEMPIVEPPAAFESAALTVMCGPFFSLMPFPPLGRHTIHHVRYTPHREWYDRADAALDTRKQAKSTPPPSRYPHMIRDAARFVPVMKDCRYLRTLWEIKTLLPRNEVDDGRPILLQEDADLPGLYSVLGGKLDNIYDVLDRIDTALSG